MILKDNFIVPLAFYCMTKSKLRCTRHSPRMSLHGIYGYCSCDIQLVIITCVLEYGEPDHDKYLHMRHYIGHAQLVRI